MGNGRWGRSSGKALSAMFMLLLAGSVLLGSGSRHYAQKANSAQLPASPVAAVSRTSLHSMALHSKPDARAILGQLPLIFEPNQGQADSKVTFLARGAGYSLFLDPTSAVLALRTAPQSQSKSRSGNSEQFVRMQLVGSNPAAATSGIES